MNKINQPLLTIAVIFGSAFLLVAMGCGNSKSISPSPEATPTIADQNVPTVGEVKVSSPIKLQPSQITRECSESEFSKLIAWRKILDSANTAIDTVKSKKDTTTIKVSIEAVKMCDVVTDHHAEQPCRKTKKTVVSTEIKYYDQARLLADCKKSTDYLIKYDARPVKNNEPLAPAPSNPTLPSQPMPVPDVPTVIQPDTGVSQGGPLKQCSTSEFAKLSEYSGQQTKADTAIKSLGAVSNWSYNAVAISAAALTVKSCEALIKYHTENPCQKMVPAADGSSQVREYSGSSLRARCHVARTYFYEYVQNTKTLIFPNADLFLDFSPLSPRIFEPGFQNQVSGNCLVENRTESTIDYSTRKARIIDTRGFEAAQIVMQTEEGLLVSCYGLNIDGPFSKRQIVKVLREEDSDIRLTYELK